MSDHCFVAFVDEAGSEGDPDKQGGFEFITLTAAVFRTQNIQFASEVWLTAARTLSKLPGHFMRDFKEINSDRDKYLIASLLSRIPMQFAAIVAHKPSIRQLGAKYGDIYHYISHLLLERISWICRDAHNTYAERNPRCKIIFSERKALRADKFIEYAKPIIIGGHKKPSNVDCSFVDMEAIFDRPHRHCEGLRVADFIAGSFGSAIEMNKKLGLTDDRFLVTLLPRAYRPRIGSKISWNNGIKLFPAEAETQEHLLEQDRFRWVHTHCFQKNE